MARSLQRQLSASATFLLSILFAYQLVSGVHSSHVLLVPMPYPSHVSQWTSIGNGLLERGHHVTVLLSSSYPELERIRNEFQFQVVDYAVVSPDFYTTPTNEATWDEWITNALLMDPIEEMRTNAEAQKVNEFCTNPLADESLPDRLLRSAFGRPDLAIVDAIPHYRCMWILCHRLGIPYVSMTTQYDPWTWRTPAIPSFVPFPYSAGGQLTEKMTFWQRVENIWTLIDWTAWPQLEIIENRFVQRYLPDETYATLAARNLLWFFDTDAVVEYPRPTMPNEINVGGLSTSPSRPLTDEKLRNFAEQSNNRLVIVSFGSMDFVSNRFFEDFFSVFKQITELNFVWRYNGEIPMEYKQSWPENILPEEQIPQNDLLGHNNTVLFISHCGANSQFEAVYHGVPMICLAVWGDQMYNAQRMHYRGYGLYLGRFGSVSTDSLIQGIRQVAFNRTYADNMRRASAIFKSRPMNGRQTAVWWIEHVIQYGGSYIHSHASDMVWYEYLMLDILAVFVVLPIAIIASCTTAFVCYVLNRRQSSWKAVRQQTEKKRQ